MGMVWIGHGDCLSRFTPLDPLSLVPGARAARLTGSPLEGCGSSLTDNGLEMGEAMPDQGTDRQSMPFSCSTRG
ncbi:hypothetical protein BaRGS_00023064, partial [Batillaria attramentaria]